MNIICPYCDEFVEYEITNINAYYYKVDCPNHPVNLTFYISTDLFKIILTAIFYDKYELYLSEENNRITLICDNLILCKSPYFAISPESVQSSINKLLKLKCFI